MSTPSTLTRRRALVALGSAGVAGLAGCTGPGTGTDATQREVAARTDDWPTVGHGYAHLGYAPGEVGPDTDSGAPAVAWSHEVFPTGTPVVAGDLALLPDDYGLRAFALDDGTERWHYEAEAGDWTTPTVVGDRVFLAAGHDGIAVLSLADGTRRRRLATDGFVTAPPTPDRDGRRVYVGTFDGTIHAFPVDPAGDAEGWSVDLFGRFPTPLSPTPYGLFAASEGGEVYGLRTADGQGRWRTKLPGLLSAPPAAVKGDVYVACLNEGLYKLRGERAGQVAWHHEGGGFVDGHLAVAAGTVFGAQGGRIVAVATDSGDRRWTADVGGSPQQGVAVAGSTAYVGARDAGVRAFSLSGGTLGGFGAGRRDWAVDLPGGAGHGLAVANGTVVSVGQGGEGTPSRVVALR